MARRRHDPTALTGLSAVVTGGSRGLGLLLAGQLYARGCSVTLAARDGAELEAGRDLLLDRHREGRGRPQAAATARVRTAVCDVRDRAAVRDLYASVAEEAGGVDVVLANAGIIQVAPLDATGAEEFRDAMDTMFMGALHASLEALPHLRRSPVGGRLGLIGSVGGLLSVPHMLPYSCAKAAVGALAEGLRAETAPSGVSVTAVHPGLMRTGSHLHAEFGGDKGREFSWFSALAGTPLLSMDAERAAARAVSAVERRSPRLVLTPAARAAGLAHGVAPALTTRLSTVVGRVLPGTDGAEEGGEALSPGAAVRPVARPVARVLRRWGSALNDRAAGRYNERGPRDRGARGLS
ncbi:SDR family oxidoreductase [Streptomyces sp. NPDC047002]|uniref:SDR family NAD(P)-dependent oxidoreductase n=1 Tax=Streptomyces sp. NPDC047002 TaxID=3155475 RepID=UPI0034534396